MRAKAGRANLPTSHIGDHVLISAATVRTEPLVSENRRRGDGVGNRGCFLGDKIETGTAVWACWSGFPVPVPQHKVPIRNMAVASCTGGDTVTLDMIGDRGPNLGRNAVQSIDHQLVSTLPTFSLRSI